MATDRKKICQIVINLSTDNETNASIKAATMLRTLSDDFDLISADVRMESRDKAEKLAHAPGTWSKIP